MAESGFFTGELRDWLAGSKYTTWAADLTEEQFKVLLSAVGELGGRSDVILECLGRHEAELFPGYGYPRARVGLQLLRQFVLGVAPTAEQYTRMVEEARAEMERPRSKGSGAER